MCEEHGPYVSTGMETVLFGEPRVWWTDCPECDKGVDADNQENDDRVATIKANALASRGIRGRMADMTFDAYTVEPGEQLKARDECLRYATAPSGDMLLVGSVGTGKTHLGVAIALAQERGVYTTLMRMVRNIRETYRKGEHDTEQIRIDRWASHNLLVIDEVGMQHCTDAERLLVYEVINDRYVQRLPTVLISNETIEGVKIVLGERVMDRLAENGRVVAFTWDSYRRRGGER
jgi:DNA replication protein DnaC